jgi:hypothetical protein
LNRFLSLRRLEISIWSLAIILGFVHVWANHHYLVNSDAMSYLDIAEAYLRRDWLAAVNTYWSPLYSGLIALALCLVNPSPYWKFAVLHLVNFAIYLFALGCFGFLMREQLRRNRAERAEVAYLTLPEWGLMALGYSLFIWSSLFLVTVSFESPDMLVAAFVYLASGILLRIRRRPRRWLPFFLLGLVLGFGYLAKSVMLPLALVFIVAGMLATGSLREGLPRIVVTILLFVVVAAPFVLSLSRSKGRFTTGETGRLYYFWTTNRLPFYHWQGETPGTGQPLHPTRKIFDDPPAYEFGDPVGGTYPVWYDPTYWHEGGINHFAFKQQVRIVVENAKRYYELFHLWGLQYGLLVGLLTLYLMGLKARTLRKDLIRQWSLILPAMAGIGLYLLVNVQGRYVASFVVLLWLALFSAVRLPEQPQSEKLINSITIILIASMIFTTIASSSRETTLTISQLVAGENVLDHEQWQVAEGLRESGLNPGDRVAFIGDSFRAFWAHLLGARVTAEIRKDRISSFWEADARVKSEVIKAFAGTGAKVMVAERPPHGTDLNGWKKIRSTEYYVYMLDQR